MSTSEFEEGRNRRLSARIFYHPNQITGQACRPDCAGPDVTNVAAATNATASVNLSCMQPTISNDQESPDLVASGLLVEGATALYSTAPAAAPLLLSTPTSSTLATTSATTTSVMNENWKSSSPSQPPRLSHSYCTGPSHMYL